MRRISDDQHVERITDWLASAGEAGRTLYEVSSAITSPRPMGAWLWLVHAGWVVRRGAAWVLA